MTSGTTMHCVSVFIPLVSSGFHGRGIPLGPCTTNPSLHTVNLLFLSVVEVVDSVRDNGSLGHVGSRVRHTRDIPGGL